MKITQGDRTALFIDGAHLFAASRALGFEVDFRAMLKFFEGRAEVKRANYYVAILEGEEYSPLKPLTDWLSYNGYMLTTKAAREYADSGGRRRVIGKMDVELAVDLMELADRIDHAIVFSGETDLRRALEAVQRRGVRVTVVSTNRTTPPLASDELRRQADQFVELMDIASEFTRPPVDTRQRLRTRRPSENTADLTEPDRRIADVRPLTVR